MSKYTEKNLIELANQLINRFGVVSDVSDVVSEEFIDKLLSSDERVRETLGRFSVEKQCVLVWFSLDENGECETDYRKTNIGQDALPYTTTTEDVMYDSRLEGKDIVACISTHVVLAAMYDILATERVIRLENGEKGPRGSRIGPYEPRPKMREFVLKTRLKHLKAKA